MQLVMQPKTACFRLISKYEYIVPRSQRVKDSFELTTNASDNLMQTTI